MMQDMYSNGRLGQIRYEFKDYPVEGDRVHEIEEGHTDLCKEMWHSSFYLAFKKL